MYVKVYKTKVCVECVTSFNTSDSRKKFCSDKCKNRFHSRIHDEIYKGTRKYHLQRLASKYNRKFNWQDLETLFQKQEGKCALSNEIMTWFAGEGKTRTNISIDRISPGGEYSLENIRLVCAIVNTMRSDMSDEELIYWAGRLC